jgi:hypothetical protein
MSDKSQIIDELRASGERIEKALLAADAADLERGRYESGWNGRQIIAHMASIEWTYPRLIDLARQASGQAPAAPSPARTAPRQTDPQSGSPQILDYNERQVAKRAEASVSELIDEFRKNRAAFIAAAESADEGLFSVQIRSAGGAQGSLADVIRFVALQHVEGHLNDITGGGS